MGKPCPLVFGYPVIRGSLWSSPPCGGFPSSLLFFHHHQVGLQRVFSVFIAQSLVSVVILEPVLQHEQRREPVKHLGSVVEHDETPLGSWLTSAAQSISRAGRHRTAIAGRS